MAITEDDVKRVARLARLKLSPEEIKLYVGQLGRILQHMEELAKLDTRKVAPTAHVLGLTNVLREDEVHGCEDPESLLKNAPAAEGPYYKVPKVIG